jgi:exo-beta-1,3-glucanase (GH17 family)
MKSTTAEHQSATPEPETLPAKSSDPDFVMVYSFVYWDHDQNATAIYPRMATPAAIAKMRGKVNEETGWVVDARELDIEGFYSGDASKPKPV